MNSVQDFSRPVAAHPLPNVAKPAKRPAEDEPFQRPAITKAGAVSQANDVKRRRTDDEDVQEAQIRPTMAPPIRQSNIRKVMLCPVNMSCPDIDDTKDAPKPSIFSHGYTSAPPPPSIAHATPSLLKSTTNNQFQLYHQQQQMLSSKPVQPMDMAKGVTGKIPFAEAPNPPHPSYRTPLPSKQPAVAAAKSSPNYPNGDAIDLPEIATDSEDEDSDDGANTLAPPDWANSPQLREILEHQQCVDPEQIFGPMVPPQMEKMFTNKDRHHRFRSRTSSANWNGQDRLTEEEIRTDVAAREKMRREGGWTYGL